MEINIKDVNKYLIDKGIKPNLRGFSFLSDAIILYSNDDKYAGQVCKVLYPDIAIKEKTTASKVERAIRHALNSAKLNFTNSHFIALAVLELSQNV